MSGERAKPVREGDTVVDAAEQEAAEREAAEPASEPVTTRAESVIRSLENAGVEYLFGVQGGAIMPVYDALFDSSMTHVTIP